MNIDQLKSTIRDLHTDLDKTGQLDPELKELLQLLDEDLHRLLSRQADESLDTSGISERLESMAADFATQHPKLAPVLREVADALAKVGI